MNPIKHLLTRNGKSNPWQLKIIGDGFFDDLDAFSEKSQNKILEYLKYIKAHPNPEKLGDAKSGDLQGIYTFRKTIQEGEVRIVATIELKIKMIKIIHVVHRDIVYKNKFKKRIAKTMKDNKVDD